MHIIFLNGSEFRGSWQEFRLAIWTPHFAALVIGMTAIVFLVQPYNHIMPEALGLRILIVSSSVAAFLLTSIGLLAMAYRRQKRVITLLPLIPAACIAAVWGVALSVALGGHNLAPPQWLQLIAVNMVFAVMGEVILASFLLSKIAERQGLNARTTPAVAVAKSALTVPPSSQQLKHAEDVQQWIDLLGSRVQSSAVMLLKAEEHYVAVETSNNSPLLLRGRLCDAIEKLPKQHGMQVHRSYWVAATAVKSVYRARDGWKIVTTSGQEIPIARNRQTAVRAWAEKILVARESMVAST